VPVAHAYNPSYLGSRDWEDGSLNTTLGKKFTRLHLKRKSWSWCHTLVISVTNGSINRRITVQTSLGKSKTLSQK
jgi:hypothetical protein